MKQAEIELARAVENQRVCDEENSSSSIENVIVAQHLYFATKCKQLIEAESAAWGTRWARGGRG